MIVFWHCIFVYTNAARIDNNTNYKEIVHTFFVLGDIGFGKQMLQF